MADDVNLTKPASGLSLQIMAEEVGKHYAKTVNNKAIDQTNGNITLTPADIAYGDSTLQAVVDALNDKVNYVKIAISSLTNDVGAVERGTKVRTVNISWKLSGSDPVKATLNGTDLTADELKAGKKTFSYPAPAAGGTDPALTVDTKYTLYVKDDHDGDATSSTIVDFKDKKYWGVGAVEPDAIDSAFLLGLASNALADGYNGNIQANPGAGEYIYFAFPTAWGTPKFSIGGFEGGFGKVKTLDFTNASGYTTSYDVYQSATANLGDTTVSVS